MSGASNLRRAARGATWPIRRILEPRFADVNRRIDYTRNEVVQETRQIGATQVRLSENIGALSAASGESMTFVGRELRSFEAALSALTERLDEKLNDIGYGRRVDAAVGGGIEGLDATTARLVAFTEGHQGFAAQRGMWTNPPLTLAYREGSVELGSVNERIVELPYAFRALGGLGPGEKLLDVGSVESTVALSLAALGYEITALDLRAYPFEHPNLEVAVSRLEDFEREAGSYAAVLAISTIEHVGLGWYGEEAQEQHADRRAMGILRELTRPGGRLVLTVPYGRIAKLDDVQRTYDAAGLSALLEGWDVEDRTIMRQRDERTWALGEPELGERGVAMITAVRPSAG